MVVDKKLQTVNWNWHRAHLANELVKGMSDEQKARLVGELQTREAAARLKGDTFDIEYCDYLYALLQGKKPEHGLSRRTM